MSSGTTKPDRAELTVILGELTAAEKKIKVSLQFRPRMQYSDDALLPAGLGTLGRHAV